jgi:type VI secretion system secreted protein VgrG
MIVTMTQQQRLLSTQIGALPGDLFIPTDFSGHEAISSLSSFSVRLLSEQPDRVFPEKILGLPASIALEMADGTRRFFHGYVNRFSRGEDGPRFTEYQAQIVPWLWFLTLTTDCRIYQDLAVPEILQQVFKDNGYLDFRPVLTGEHVRRDYCVQYRESDFHFVSRLMEEEGIWYYFEHTQDRHTLVYTDTLQAHRPCPVQAEIHIRSEGDANMREDTINSWEVTRSMRSDRWTMRDYHFQMSDKTLEFTRAATPSGNGTGKPRWEVFDYPGDYAVPFNKPGQRLDKVMPEGEKVVRLRLEEEETQHLEIHGASDCRSFSPGFTFQLLDLPPGSPRGSYLLLSVRHAAAQGSVLASGEATDGDYSNTFTCLAPGSTYRPRRSTKKPVVAGPQTAVVVGIKNQEFMVDEYGRVKVQFHWDRYGKENENSSCWLRVAQVWAGKRWGASFWPRIGQEVIVAFLEGDPDQPIIVGSVYNDLQRPPYLGGGPDSKHPHDPKVSGIKTCSTPGGNGFNEIRFDDTKGKEQLFLRAENTMDVRVGGDQHVSVGRQRHLIVGNDCLQQFKADKKTDVAGKEETTVGFDQKLWVKGSRDVKVNVVQTEEFLALNTNASQWINTYAKNFIYVATGGVMQLVSRHHQMDTTEYLATGAKAVFEFGSICLKCGSSFILLNSDGVWIQGPQINLNSGGAATSLAAEGYTSPPEPAVPGAVVPLAADESRTGFPSAPDAKIAPPRPNPPAAPSPSTPLQPNK